MDYIEQIKKEYPNIKPFEEDDWDWEKEGYEFFNAGNYKEAEELFKKLVLAQPRHHSGYEGLAYLYYEMKDYEKSEWFMKLALEKAKRFLESNSIDQKVIDEMDSDLSAIQNRKEIKRHL
jgi:tetratricopeptide (TPR) repeat protein